MKYSITVLSVILLILAASFQVRSVMAQPSAIVNMSLPDFGYIVSSCPSADGGMLVVGAGSKGGVLLKVSASGSVDWRRNLYDAIAIQPLSIAVNTSGDIICAGYYQESGFLRPVIQQYSGDGLLKKTVVFKINSTINSCQLILSHDGSYILNGTMLTPDSVPYVIHLDQVFAVTAAYRIEATDITSTLSNYQLAESADGGLVLLANYAALFTAIRINHIHEVDTQRFYQLPSAEMLTRTMLLHSNGSVFAVGELGGATFCMMHFNKGGALQSIQSLDKSIRLTSQSLREDADGSIVFSGQQLNSFMRCIRFDTAGTALNVVDIRSPSLVLSSSVAMPLPQLRLGFIVTTVTQHVNNQANSDVYIGLTDATLNSCFSRSTLAFPSPIEVTPKTYTSFYTVPIPINSVAVEYSISSVVVPATNPICTDAVDQRTFHTIVELPITPNPVSLSSVGAIATNGLKSGRYVITVRSLAGAICYRAESDIISGDAIEIPTSGLAAGYYLVECLDPTTFAITARGKFIKK